MHSRFYLAFILSAALPSLTLAHPISYKGAFSVMTWNQPDASDWMTTYTFSRDAAVAGRALRVDTEAGVVRAGLIQANSLLKRWNEADTQGNVYLSVGAGTSRREDHDAPAAFAAFQADHESRWHILMVEGSGLVSEGHPGLWRWEARAGLAPYLAEFDEPASWLILSLQGNPGMRKDLSLTPLIRVFYKNVLGEAGAGLGGDWMLNFMVHF